MRFSEFRPLNEAGNNAKKPSEFKGYFGNLFNFDPNSRFSWQRQYGFTKDPSTMPFDPNDPRSVSNELYNDIYKKIYSELFHTYKMDYKDMLKGRTDDAVRYWIEQTALGPKMVEPQIGSYLKNNKSLDNEFDQFVAAYKQGYGSAVPALKAIAAKLAQISTKQSYANYQRAAQYQGVKAKREKARKDAFAAMGGGTTNTANQAQAMQFGGETWYHGKDGIWRNNKNVEADQNTSQVLDRALQSINKPKPPEEPKTNPLKGA